MPPCANIAGFWQAVNVSIRDFVTFEIQWSIFIILSEQLLGVVMVNSATAVFSGFNIEQLDTLLPGMLPAFIPKEIFGHSKMQE